MEQNSVPFFRFLLCARPAAKRVSSERHATRDGFACFEWTPAAAGIEYELLLLLLCVPCESGVFGFWMVTRGIDPAD